MHVPLAVRPMGLGLYSLCTNICMKITQNDIYEGICMLRKCYSSAKYYLMFATTDSEILTRNMFVSNECPIYDLIHGVSGQRGCFALNSRSRF